MEVFITEKKKKNGLEIKPLKIKNNSKKCQIFGSEKYPIFVNIAKRNSGKTVSVSNVLKHIINENPDDIKCVIIFASTIRKDPTWIDLLEFFNKKEIPYLPMDSTFSKGETDRKCDRINELDSLLRYLKQNGNRKDKFNSLNPFNSDSEDDDGIELDPRLKNTEEDEEEDNGKYIIVIDDLPNELKNNPAIPILFKTNRHLKTMVIANSQDVIDFPPSCLSQITHANIFGRIPCAGKNSRLYNLHNKLDLELDYPIFKQLYLNTTTPREGMDKCYDFLFIDVVNNKYRKNYNTDLIVDF